MSNTLQLPQCLSVGSLGAYIHWANQIPLLTEEKEKDLAERLKYKHDLDAARQLVVSHLRLVIRIARGYSGYGLPQADLIQEGNVGLMKAVKRFDPTVGVRLVSFAIHWIRAEIHEFVLRNWRIVKIATTKAQRKLFFNLRKQSKKRSWFSADEIDTVAESLNVSHADVRQMEARLNNQDESFENDDQDGSTNLVLTSNSPYCYLEAKSDNPEKLLETNDWSNNQEKNLYTALATLDKRSQAILRQRWLNKKKQTLQDLARCYNVSAERIRQLEQNALRKMRIAMAI